MTHRCAAVLLWLTLGTSSAAQGSSAEMAARALLQDPHTEADTLIQEARDWRDRLVAEYGIVVDQQLTHELETVLRGLERAAGLVPGHLRLTVIRSPGVNAHVGGREVVVRGGLVSFTQSLAASRDARHAKSSGSYLRYVTAVLAHELAHATLGHRGRQRIACEIGNELASRNQNARSEGALGDLEVAECVRTEAEQAQQRELEADRHGALYMFRAGWDIEDAIQLQLAFERAKRRGGVVEDLHLTSYVASHPRSSARAAELERFRADLRMHQSRLDDAVTYIAHNTELERAVSLLDEILADLPDFLPAAHARATALHQEWLNRVGPHVQQVRASLVTWADTTLLGIRGANEAPQVRDRARRAYEEILAQSNIAHPATLSNLAVLDAYAGTHDDAFRRATGAVQAAPSDPFLWNNLGVVLFVAGRYADAAEAFRRALARETAGWERHAPAFVFNLGRTLHRLGHPEANEVLTRYLEVDPASAWRLEALEMLGLPEGAAARSPAPPPVIGGITLGASKDEVLVRLGQPDREVARERVRFMVYSRHGLAVAYDAAERVRAVQVGADARASVEAVNVGDGVRAAVDRWGAPVDRTAEALVFDRGDWMVRVSQENGLIRGILIWLR